MSGYAQTKTVQKSDKSRSVIGNLGNVTGMIMSAFWRDMVISFAVHGNAMSCCPPIDFAAKVWRESDLDVLLSVEERADQTELKEGYLDPNVFSPMPDNGCGYSDRSSIVGVSRVLGRV